MSRSGWWWAPLCRKNERGPESEASSQRRKAGAARACTCTCTHARCIRRPARVTRRGLSDRRWDTIGKDLNEINFRSARFALRKPAKPSAAHSPVTRARRRGCTPAHTADRAHRVTRRPRIRWRCSSVRGPKAGQRAPDLALRRWTLWPLSPLSFSQRRRPSPSEQPFPHTDTRTARPCCC